MPDQDAEQVLACLHADALLLQSRLQLRLGVCQAAARQQRLTATLEHKRERHAEVYGTRTKKDKQLTAAISRAKQAPQTAPVSAMQLLCLLLETGSLACQRCESCSCTQEGMMDGVVCCATGC
jgi:hypothetical protein